jgi:hypothetical protein
VLSKNSFKLFRLLNTNDPREYKNKLLRVGGFGVTTNMLSCYCDDLLRKNSYFSSFSTNKYPGSQDVFEYIKKNNKELFFKKDLDYRDEDEYRVVVCKSNENKLPELESIGIQTAKIIKGIIVGDRFPKVYKPIVEQLCNELKIECKKLHWGNNGYWLLDGL